MVACGATIVDEPLVEAEFLLSQALTAGLPEVLEGKRAVREDNAAYDGDHAQHAGLT